jgi:hypothetical protein
MNADPAPCVASLWCCGRYHDLNLAFIAAHFTSDSKGNSRLKKRFQVRAVACVVDF